MTADAGDVLKYYPLHPERVLRFGKIIKIEAEEGTFALKETVLPRSRLQQWEQTVRCFEKGQLPAAVPVLPTADGRYYVRHNGFIYYLMPWEEQPEHCTAHDLFQTLARFHLPGRKIIQVPETVYRKNSAMKERQMEHDIYLLETYVEEVEQQRFFSPFELLALTCLPLIYECRQRSAGWFENWKAEVLETEKTQEVLCHGKPSFNHVLADSRRRLRFINLEASAVGHPAHDIAGLYRSCVKRNIRKRPAGKEWIDSYETHQVFHAADKALLKSLLLYPSVLLYWIRKGPTRPPGMEPEWTRKLAEEKAVLENILRDIHPDQRHSTAENTT
ncbi:hypothetical protein [Salibacterium sp. K-3]